MKNTTWINNVATIWQNEKGNYSAKFGDVKNQKTPLHVTLTIKDGSGNIIAQVDNPSLLLQDPYKNMEESKAQKLKDMGLKFRMSLGPAKD